MDKDNRLVQRTVSPVDGSIYLERAYAGPEDIESALARAVNAQRDWKRRSLAERVAILERFVSFMESRADAIGEELTWQMGRPIRYTPFEIRRGFAERARYMLQAGPAALADIGTEPRAGFSRFIRREPLGVVLTVAPWNYPYLTSVNSIVPALAAGNAVILKHSAQTPLCSERYGEGLREAGLPDGVFQYLHLRHEDVSRMIGDRRIQLVAFTGSVAGGKAIEEAAAGRFIGVGLELGGKDPAYVRRDADLANAVENLVDGAMFNSGQSCCGIERIYVHRDLYRDFVDGFVALTKQYTLGNPLDPATTLGPMVRAGAAEFVRAQVSEAVGQGATAHIDSRLFAADQPGSAYLAPQVLTEVHHAMRVMREETFGPVAGIMPVAGDSEAIALMNDSPYGLTASIWTRDIEAAERIGAEVETGTWFMNRCDYLDPALAWTGVKDSGRGCALSALGYGPLTRPKSYHLKV